MSTAPDYVRHRFGFPFIIDRLPTTLTATFVVECPKGHRFTTPRPSEHYDRHVRLHDCDA